METKIMTKNELVNRVNDFFREIEPTIKAMNEGEDNKKAGMVFSMVLPNGEDDTHHSIRAILGNGGAVMQAVENLDEDDCHNLIRKFLEAKRAKMLREARHAFNDLMKDFGEFLKEKEGENAETEDDTETQNEDSAE